MKIIQYGSVEFFMLESLKTDISSKSLDKLGLTNLDKLRHEVDFALMQCIFYSNSSMPLKSPDTSKLK
jgi:hypothetical protein